MACSGTSRGFMNGSQKSAPSAGPGGGLSGTGARSGGPQEGAPRQGWRIATGRWRAARSSELSRQSASRQGQGSRGQGLMPPCRPRQAAGWQTAQADQGRNGPRGIHPPIVMAQGREPISDTRGFASYARLLQQPPTCNSSICRSDRRSRTNDPCARLRFANRAYKSNEIGARCHRPQ